jgi:branched-chain amino acid transport system substrate-binding protein
VASENASGGINGHKIDLTFKDDQINPGNALTDIQELLSEHPVAIVDDSLVDAVWASKVQASGIPVVGGSFTSTLFGQNPDFYPPGGTSDSFNYGYISLLKAAGVSNYGIVYASVEASNYVQEIVPEAKKVGLTETYKSQLSETAPNYTAQCVAAQQAHIKALLVEEVAPTTARFATDCSRQGYFPIYITGGTSYEDPWATTPGLKDSLVTPYQMLPYWDTSVPAVQAMNDAVTKYYPGTRKAASWNESSVLAWPSGVLLEHAIKAGGLGPSDTPSAAEVVKGLTSLKGDTLDGWSPPLTFVAGQPHAVDCWFTGKLANGKPMMVNNGQVTCHTGP